MRKWAGGLIAAVVIIVMVGWLAIDLGGLKQVSYGWLCVFGAIVGSAAAAWDQMI
jgi:hypothetical protein